MDSAAGLADLPAKLLSQCGLVATMLAIAVGWLSVQLAKTRAAWEADRAESVKLRDLDRELYIKLLENKNELELKLTVALAKVEGLVLLVQARGEDD